MKVEVNLKRKYGLINITIVLSKHSTLATFATRIKMAVNFILQEAHGPHRSPEKTVQINKHI